MARADRLESAPAIVFDQRTMIGSSSPRAFFRRHWQKKPLLARGALPERPRLSGDELAGLACEEEVESRLVLGSVERGFRLEPGPFPPGRFARLPKRDWTLLVQDVDKHVPRVARLLESFLGFPEWRLDDVMVSFAAPGGSVGPHVDAYDVFLVQLRGKRRWQLSRQTDLELRKDSELKLLERFVPEEEHVVGPGDVLYLPPGVAHYGVAETACMTASIGFRAPSQEELLADFLQELAARPESDERYADPDLEPRRDPSELAAHELDRLRALVRAGLAVSDARIDDFLGRYLTRLKPSLELAFLPEAPPSTLREVLPRGARTLLARAHASRWLRVASSEGPRWFVNGVTLDVPRAAERFVAALADGQTRAALGLADDAASARLLLELGRAGALRVVRGTADGARGAAPSSARRPAPSGAGSAPSSARRSKRDAKRGAPKRAPNSGASRRAR